MRVTVALVAASAVFLGVVLLVSWPVDVGGLSSSPSPARTYEEAAGLAAVAGAAEADSVAEPCRAVLLGHGARTARAFVLIHGYANCPNQFLPLAERLFAAGHNVYLPRLPGHGIANRMTNAMSQVDASALAGAADEAVDVAAGLGDEITVVGLSAGGTVSAWAATQRPEVSRAVLLAPVFGIRGVPEAAIGLTIHLLTWLPDQQIWWDARVRERLPGPELAYPRFSTHALGECMRLGTAVREAADVATPAARSITFVLNASERSLHNGVCRSLAAAWERKGVSVAIEELPGAWKLNHDFVDPAQPGARPDDVYPILQAAILGP